MDQDTYLYHHGIKGMKWGVRKSKKSSKQNKNYSSKQRKRDQNVYSKGAVRRINKRMNKGESISSARSKEASRINSTRSAARYAGTAGRVVGTAAGVIGGAVLSNLGMKKLSSITKSVDLSAALQNPNIRYAVAGSIGLGVSKAAGQAGADAGRAAVMKSRGYSAKKYR